MKLLAASALLCGRRIANASDLWVLRYVWDREEQIALSHSLESLMMWQRIVKEQDTVVD